MCAVFHVPTECLYETDTVDLANKSTKSIVVWHEAGHAAMQELLVACCGTCGEKLSNFEGYSADQAGCCVGCAGLPVETHAKGEAML